MIFQILLCMGFNSLRINCVITFESYLHWSLLYRNKFGLQFLTRDYCLQKSLLVVFDSGISKSVELAYKISLVSVITQSNMRFIVWKPARFFLERNFLLQIWEQKGFSSLQPNTLTYCMTTLSSCFLIILLTWNWTQKIIHIFIFIESL